MLHQAKTPSVFKNPCHLVDGQLSFDTFQLVEGMGARNAAECGVLEGQPRGISPDKTQLRKIQVHRFLFCLFQHSGRKIESYRQTALSHARRQFDGDRAGSGAEVQ